MGKGSNMIFELLKDNVEQLEAFDEKLKQAIESLPKEQLWPVFIMILEELYSQQKGESHVPKIVDRLGDIDKILDEIWWEGPEGVVYKSVLDFYWNRIKKHKELENE